MSFIVFGIMHHYTDVLGIRREKTAPAAAEEFGGLYRKRFPKAVSVFEAGMEDALTYLGYPGSHHAVLPILARHYLSTWAVLLPHLRSPCSSITRTPLPLGAVAASANKIQLDAC